MERQLAQLGKAGESGVVRKVDRGVAASSSSSTASTTGTAFAPRSTSATSALAAATATALGAGRLAEGLLDFEKLLALLLGTGLGLLRLGGGEVLGLFLFVPGQLGVGRVVSVDLSGSLGLDVELLASLGGEVFVKSHGLVFLFLFNADIASLGCLDGGVGSVV